MKKLFFILYSITFVNINIFAEQDIKQDILVNKVDLSTLYPLNRIESVIYAQDGQQIITRLDIERPTLDMRSRTLQDLKFEYLLFDERIKYKMSDEEDMVDKYMAQLQKSNNLSKEDVTQLFLSAGYSYQEGRAELKRSYIGASLSDFLIKSRLIVPESEVLAYYNDNPEIQEATLQLTTAVVPISTDTNIDELKSKLDNYCATGKGIFINWSKPFWVNQNDIANDKILNLKTGETIIEQELGRFDLTKLLNKKEAVSRSLEERYKEIVDILRRPKFEEILSDLKKELFEQTIIIDLQDAKSLLDLENQQK